MSCGKREKKHIILIVRSRSITMEWTRLIFCAIVFILLCNAYGFDAQMEGLPGSVTLQTDLPSPPCVQDFRKREADCSARNLRHVPTNLIADLLSLFLEAIIKFAFSPTHPSLITRS